MTRRPSIVLASIPSVALFVSGIEALRVPVLVEPRSFIDPGGHDHERVAFVTPDGKRAYAADPVGNQTLVVDIPTMKEVAKIPVGQVPKRNHTMVIPASRPSTN